MIMNMMIMNYEYDDNDYEYDDNELWYSSSNEIVLRLKDTHLKRMDSI